MSKQSLSRLKITILLLSLIQMGSVFMSPVIKNLIEAFPDSRPGTVQMLMTFPNLVVMAISFFIGKLEASFTKRSLCILACSLILFGALGMFFLHNSLPVLFLFSACIGAGAGILLSITATMISLYFQGDERASLTGLQNSFTNLGGMLLNLLGGILAGIAWHFDFLAPLILVPGFILVFFFVPNEKGVRKTSSKIRIPGRIILFYAVIILFGILFNLVPTNISLLISEKGFGSSTLSGVLAAVFLSGGILGGVIYPVLKDRFFDKSIAFAFLNLGIGILLISASRNVFLTGLGAFIGGCSITISMSQMVFSISKRTESFVTPTAISLLMAANNFGNFISPGACSLIPAKTLASRFMVAGFIALFLSVSCFLVFEGRKSAEAS